MTALYQIRADIEEVLANVDQETGEITKEQLAELEALEVKLEEKVLNCVGLIKAWRYDAAALKEESDKLRARAKVIENQIDRMKDYIGDHVEKGEKIEGLFGSARWQKNPISVRVDDETTIPDLYFVTPKPVLSKTLVRQAIEAGKKVKGACLQQGWSLRIK